ncbi:MAG: hypothetical protein Q7S19_01120 [bacterium]|nr:hypothetical protein [bacterium]
MLRRKTRVLVSVVMFFLSFVSLLAFYKLEASYNEKTWKTITLGTGLKTGKEFLYALQKKGCGVSYYAMKMIESPTFASKIAPKELKIDLVVVEVADLDLKNGGTIKDIYTRAAKRGLLPCPAEAGPQLRMQYRDQPVGERLVIAMDSIDLPTGFSGIFAVEYPEPSGLFLHGGNDGTPEAVYPANTHFVFMKLK